MDSICFQALGGGGTQGTDASAAVQDFTVGDDMR
jgi:hypothetical protein